jgi:rhodanese-related sulfurtransferase
VLRKGDQDLTMIQEPVYVCCRLGNDSQASVRLLKDKYGFKRIWDIKGGLTEWSEKVDDKFPRY